MASFGTIQLPPQIQTGLSIVNSTLNNIISSVFDSGGVFSVWTFQVTGSGTFTTGAAQLQGSLDGTNWFNLSAALTLAAGTVALTTTGQAWRFARINTSTAVTGGGTITACAIAAADG